MNPFFSACVQNAWTVQGQQFDLLQAAWGNTCFFRCERYSSISSGDSKKKQGEPQWNCDEVLILANVNLSRPWPLCAFGGHWQFVRQFLFPIFRGIPGTQRSAWRHSECILEQGALCHMRDQAHLNNSQTLQLKWFHPLVLWMLILLKKNMQNVVMGVPSLLKKVVVRPRVSLQYKFHSRLWHIPTWWLWCVCIIHPQRQDCHELLVFQGKLQLLTVLQGSEYMFYKKASQFICSGSWFSTCLGVPADLRIRSFCCGGDHCFTLFHH